MPGGTGSPPAIPPRHLQQRVKAPAVAPFARFCTEKQSREGTLPPQPLPALSVTVKKASLLSF